MLWSKGIIYSIRFIFIVNTIYLVFNLQFLLVGLLIGSLLLTFIPEIFTKISNVKITMTGRVVYTVFIFGTQWLGTYLRLYDSLIWWDIMLHFSSGILLGYVGLLILLWIDKEGVVEKNIRFRVIILFSFLVSVSGAVFWEIMEFLADTIFGSNTQLGSLQDTMEDMVFGTLGAILFVIYMYLASHKKKKTVLERLIEIN
ncbi:hypothetical protein [Cellulosilyticum sp. I15G10I2]|uniref:hypothetical protein n=1 Tax=Cellulosilyticum sp. I15G10I2 TaxID=1892843 RepID=UPI00085CB125|nr:hypothetical protein [Cellulosilyticum sp. I15G10I2]